MTVRLIGANPGLTLFPDDAGDVPVAYASVWRVDWSPRGTGTAVVLWQAGATRVITPSPELGRWLAEDFNRHFPELKGLRWATPEVTTAPVALELDLARGMRTVAADVEVEISEPLDRRLIQVDSFDLGGTPLQLSTVLMPCRAGSLRIGGELVPGAPRVRTTPRTSSTAFLADAEVWCEPPG